jgi:hypothetical protein
MKMLYAGFNFFINEDGLLMADKDPEEMLRIEKTPLEIGDSFVLTTAEDGNLFFMRTGPKQLELDL